MPDYLPKNFSWYSQVPLAKVALAELFGTACLLFAIGCVVTLSSVPAICGVAVAASVIALCNCVGDFSGAHFNPCITFPLYMIESRFPLHRAGLYMLSEILGGVCGVRVAAWFMGGTLHNPYMMKDPKDDGYITPGRVLFCEIFWTMILVFVVLKSGMTHSSGNELCCVWVGCVIIASSIMGGPISGASLNPAVGFAFTLFFGHWSDLWYNSVGPMLGGILAVVLFVLFDPELYFRRVGKFPTIKAQTPVLEGSNLYDEIESVYPGMAHPLSVSRRRTKRDI